MTAAYRYYYWSTVVVNAYIMQLSFASFTSVQLNARDNLSKSSIMFSDLPERVCRLIMVTF